MKDKVGHPYPCLFTLDPLLHLREDEWTRLQDLLLSTLLHMGREAGLGVFFLLEREAKSILDTLGTGVSSSGENLPIVPIPWSLRLLFILTPVNDTTSAMRNQKLNRTRPGIWTPWAPASSS